MGNEIVNALKRLERAGSEHSRATRKLMEAVDVAAASVCQIVESATEGAVGSIDLPGQYVYECHCSHESSDHTTLDRYTGAVERYGGTEEYLTEPVYSSRFGYPSGDTVPSREVALRFAWAIATGWLDELAAWLEARARESEQAAQTLAERQAEHQQA